MTVHEIVVDAKGRLSLAGIRESEARLDAEVLARQVLGWDRARFLVNRDDEAPSGFLKAYDQLITRRAQREPTSYIVGSREFWGLDFEVSGDVLIPRPETEVLVEEALACWQALQARPTRPVIVDAGTGCGCVAVALAHQLRQAYVVATDISHAALVVARRNAVRHRVAGRVAFVRTDFLAGVGRHQSVDLVVSNPPYVPQPQAPGLTPEVREFEPHVALFGGSDGLEKQRALLAQATDRLAPSGYLLLEFGDGQEDGLRQAISEHAELRVVRVRNDLRGIPRTMTVTHV